MKYEPTDQELLTRLQESIVKIYDEFGIKFIRDLDARQYGRPDDSMPSWYLDVIRQCNIYHNRSGYWPQLFDDICYCNEDLGYFTSQLHLYRPFLNNPSSEGVAFGDGIIFPNFTSVYDKRYNTIASTCSEKLYNFWDRIGDLINLFFPLPEGKNIYFPSTIDRIPVEFQNSEHYKWLKEFRDGKYKLANDERIQAVHYNTKESQLRYKHLENCSDAMSMAEYQTERESLADDFKDSLSDMITGFIHTLHFLKEVNHKLYPEPND
jgi:hypothetical protein